MALWAGWILLFAAVSAMLPRDVSYDVAHYHIHNGWSALHGRLDVDAAPAELHSFLNPAYNLWAFWLMTALPGPLVAMILSVPHALVLPALYGLTRSAGRGIGVDISAPVALIVAATGLLAAPSILLMASVRNDIWGALAFIFALMLLMPADQKPPSLQRLAVASLAVGLMAGLKLTNAVYVLGLAAGVMVAIPGIWPRVKAGLTCALVGLGGIILTGGPWAYILWRKFANPVFPMMNGIFGAPLGTEGSFRDERYLPDNLLDLLTYPFQFLLDGQLINEDPFVDARFLLTYLASFAIIAAGIWSWHKQTGRNLRGPLTLACALLLPILAWLQMFAIQRYMLAAWLLGPVFLILSVAIWRPGLLVGRQGLYKMATGALAIILTTQPPTLRRVEWESLSEPYVWVNLPYDMKGDDSLILFAGGSPQAFTAIGFPKSAIFTHIFPPSWSHAALANYHPHIKSVIDQQSGPIWMVTFDLGKDGPTYKEAMAERYQLDLQLSQCRALSTAFDIGEKRWEICPANQM